MNIDDFLADPEWDAPFVKELAQYETPGGKDNISGFYVSKEFVGNFPHLSSDDVTSENPTNEKWITVDMYRGTQYIETNSVRYQFQTRGGTRTPEYWMTHINTLRKIASVGDLWITQRKIGSLGDHYRFILVKEEREKSVFKDASYQKPISMDQIDRIGDDINNTSLDKFRDSENRTITSVDRAVRNSLFRSLLLEHYDTKCCVSKLVLLSQPAKLNPEQPDPKPVYEVEAAHIKPVKDGGPDDVRNGILLSRTLHWAFDQGLFTINSDHKVRVSPKAPSITQANLEKYNEKKILLPADHKLHPHPDALEWHNNEIFQN